MRQFLRSPLKFICILFIAAGCVASLLSLMLVAAMLVAWAHDGRLIGNDESILTKGIRWFAASSVFVCFVGWLYRMLLGDKDDTLRIVPSRSVRPTGNPGGAIDILFYAVLAFILHGLVPASPLRTPIVIGWLGVIFAGVHAHIFFHELGHLVVAFALRFKLGALYVGVGPLLASTHLPGGMRIVWRLWPRSGLAQARDRAGRNRRIRQLLFIAGGPLADATILVLGSRFVTCIWGGYGRALTYSAGSFVTVALLFAVLITALNGLVPQTFWRPEGIVRTDGWGLLRTLLAPRGMIGFSGDPSWLDALGLLQTSEVQPRFVKSESVNFRAQQERLQSRLRPGGR